MSSKHIIASIIIPVHNNLHLTKTCLECIRQNSTGVEYEVIVIDNGSTDGTREFLHIEQKAGRLRAIFSDTNLGFAKACNLGAREALGKYVVLLNNDTEPLKGWLQSLLDVAEGDEKIAAVGAKLLYPDGTVQHAGVAFSPDGFYPITPVHIYQGAPGDAPYVNRQREFQAVTAACMLIRKNIFLALGGLDETFVNGYEDVDFCLRARECGYKVVYNPGAVVVHHESKTSGRHDREHENLVHLHKKWLGRVLSDYENYLEEDGVMIKINHSRVFRTDRPPCSIVIITHNSLQTIAPCLRSLEETTTPSDEIILVDNASTDTTKEYLQIWAKDRVNVILLLNDENRGFSAAVNQGIALSSRPFVVLLNPDVFVSHSWLERILEHFKDPRVGAVGPVSNYAHGYQKYKLYLGTIRFSGKATPTQISNALYTRNKGRGVETPLLTGFCIVIRRSALEEVGRLDGRLFMGNDDLALSWKLRERGYKLLVATDVFVYHVGHTSFANKPQELRDRWIQESTDELMEQLVSYYGWGNVPPPEDLWGITWFKPSSKYATAFRKPNPISVLTSIVIPVHNQLAFTRRCLQSILAFTLEPIELIIVDNGSDDGTEQYLQELAKTNPRVTVIRNPENVGFPVACNQGMARAKGDAILILNNDTIVSEGWLRRLHRCLASESNVGLVGPVSNYVAGEQYLPECSYNSIEEMFEFSKDRAKRYYGFYLDTNRVTGLCMLIRREVIKKIGGFDPRFSPGNFEDDDFCLRARIAGYRIKISLDTFIHHFGNKTFIGSCVDYETLMKRNLSLFLAKWGLPPYIDLETFYAEYADTIAEQPFDGNRHFVPLVSQGVAIARR
ncbi:MAG: glycosyltransferase family 2 protein [Thermofilaceae archaeon]|nr:glycosyltransferase family 2 protein [Armatimonadota bacterium]